MRPLPVTLIVILSLILLAGCVQQSAPPSETPPTQAPKARIVQETPTVVPQKPTEAPTAEAKPSKPSSPTSVYYAGKTIQIIVGSTAGGGTDTVARITATFLPKYIPGNPSFVIRNQPEASGLAAVAGLQNKTKPDGLTLLQNSSSSVSLQLRGRHQNMFDLLKNEEIGNVISGGSPVFLRKGTLPRLTDPRTPTLVYATKDGSETSLAISLWGKELLGWNVRWITGFSGTSEMELAFMRGEVDMFGANTDTTRRLNDQGLIEFLAQTGTFRGNDFVRRPIYPDIPTLGELLGSKKPEGTSWQAYLAWIGPGLVDKFLEAPPNTPSNIVEILRAGFIAMIKDPGFDAQTKRQFSEIYETSTGKDTQNTIKAILSTPPEAIEYMLQLQRKYDLIK